jgi:hypothetical protein
MWCQTGSPSGQGSSFSKHSIALASGKPKAAERRFAATQHNRRFLNEADIDQAALGKPPAASSRRHARQYGNEDPLHP